MFHMLPAKFAEWMQGSLSADFDLNLGYIRECFAPTIPHRNGLVPGELKTTQRLRQQ